MQPHIRTGILSGFLSTISMLGGEPDRVVALSGVERSSLSNPDAYIPYCDYLKLHAIAANETGCPHFGLELSRTAGAGHLGVTGFVMSQAETLGEAWRALESFYHVHDTYGVVALNIRDGLAWVSYVLPDNSAPGTRGAIDVAVGVTVNINHMLTGRPFSPAVLQLPYERPADIAPYEALSAGRLQFDRGSYAMGFDAGLLERPVVQSDPQIKAILAEYMLKLEQSSEHRYSRQVEELINQLLPTGECCISRIADFMSVSPRTLQNRLGVEHTSFHLLLEKARRERAVRHLSAGDLSYTDLAFRLGYSELSAFSRSFKRWYGRSPRQWQRENNVR